MTDKQTTKYTTTVFSSSPIHLRAMVNTMVEHEPGSKAWPIYGKRMEVIAWRIERPIPKEKTI
jgi:hypothetical protein